jgi:putative transposase
MARKRLSVKLPQDEYDFLTTYVAHGQKNARCINRARTLLLSHDGKDDQEIANILGISRATVYNVRKKYHQQQYDHIVEVLHDKPHHGRPIAFDHKVEANVAMIACSEAPKGAARWTLHLIADKLVQLHVVDSISHESVRNLLKKQTQALAK